MTIDAKSKKRVSVKGIDFSCPKDVDVDTFLDYAESDSWSGSTFTRVFTHIKIIDKKITHCDVPYIAEIYMGVKISLEVRHFDCCHAGGIFLDTRDTTRQFVLERWGGAPIVQGVTAVTADETAIERNGNGLFTRTLCEQLEGGDIFEMHRQEYVTGDQLFSRVTTLVMEEAQNQRHAMTPMHKPILAKHGGEQCYGEMLFVRPGAVPLSAGAVARGGLDTS